MSYLSARDHRGDLEISADVVIVGSGASGAVVADELQRSGQRVVVLEEGPRIDADEYARMTIAESLRHMWRDGGMTVAAGVGDSPMINVTMGRVVGGSSVVTGGVCFRTPDSVLASWQHSHGLPDYSPRAMEEAFESVEKRIHVETVPEAMRSISTTLFDRGLRKQGVDLEPMRRNTKGCNGCGRCNFGCPEKAKLSVDRNYLPSAVEAGADVFSHCLVEKVVSRGGRAVGVTGRILNGRGGRAGGKLRVHARRVVIACGAWHTPLVLKRSGIGRRSEALGRRMTLHPGCRMMARFEQRVEGWKGALQSAFTDAFEARGLTLTSLFIPPSVIAATLPGIGPEHLRHAEMLPHIALFGGIVHDEGSGTVRRGPGREPLVTYRMAGRDRSRVRDLIRLLGETYIDAGAKEVFPPILGLSGGLTPDEFRALDLESLPMRRFEVTSQHPLGTARMGPDGKRAVVDTDGRAFDLDELYVVDGSIVPTSLGVNPQLSIMALATRLARRMRERPLHA